MPPKAAPLNHQPPLETPAPIGDDSETERLVFFSDAVIAIVITLLVLDIRVPRAEQLPAGVTLVDALLQQWPTYLSFVISFVIIGETWVNHHTMFRYIRRADHGLMFINMLLLLCIAAIPFSTALLAEYIQRPEQAVGAFVYGLTLTVGGLVFNLLWWYAARRPSLMTPHVSTQVLRAIGRRYLLGPLLYGVATALALVSVPASLAIYLFLAVLFFLPSPAPVQRAAQQRQPRG